MRVLSTGVMTRGITDCGVAVGAAAALALGVWRVSHGLMSIQALLIVLMAGTEVFRPLRDLRTVLHRAWSANRPPPASTRCSPPNRWSPAAARPAGDQPRRSLPTIAFEDVCFAYPGGRGAAHDGLSFTVAAGEKIGIVGPSGSGKSSVARLLLRLFDPQRARCKIGGHDLQIARSRSAAPEIAVVHQDTYLFHGTVEENLRLGKPDATAHEIEAAARDANAHDFITQLPQGYQTMIGERGARLSGGQRQRLAIARALLRDAPILILDEALSSVDAENEAVIQQAIDRLSAGRTTLILAHRLSSVIGADRILVLDNGRIVESGRHAELIRRDGAYRRLMGAQAEERGDDVDLLDDDPAARAPATREPIDYGEAATATDAMAEAAASVGWAATLGTLMRDHRAVAAAVRHRRRRPGSPGSPPLSASASSARWPSPRSRPAAPFGYLLILLGLLAPLAGLLHWLESWLAHDIAYRLLAEMRIELFRKLDTLAPAYLVRRRSGDLIALASQDIETIEYFFAHTVAPALVAILVPTAVLLTLAVVAWPIALAMLPFVLYAGLAPVVMRTRIDRLGAQARDGLGLLGAYVTETIQGLSDLVAFQAVRPAARVHGAGARLPDRSASNCLRDLSSQTAQLEIVTGLGGLAVAIVGARLAAEHQLDGHHPAAC